MKYALLALTLLIVTIPGCSLRKTKKKQSVHRKRKASQMEAYASNPGDSLDKK